MTSSDLLIRRTREDAALTVCYSGSDAMQLVHEVLTRQIKVVGTTT
jgi:hypothetical protein